MKDNKSRLFSSESRMSDLITAHPSLLSMITRLGIPLGFGDRSIADVCDASGVNTTFFLLICNVYTFNNYVPSTAVILGTDMTGLVPYLRNPTGIMWTSACPTSSVTWMPSPRS